MAVAIRAVRAAGRATTGTQDFTVSGFGTPVAAMFIWSLSTTNATEVASQSIGIGFTDGTRDRCSFASADAGVTTTETACGNSNVACIDQIDEAGGNIAIAVFAAFITDGIRVNWTTVTGAGELITCILFGGTDIVNVHVGDFAIDTVQNNVVDITDPGFEPNFVIFAAPINCNANQTRSNTGTISLAFAANSTSDTVCGITRSSRDGRSTVEVATKVFATRIPQLTVNGGQDNVEFEIGTFDSNGFSCTTRDNAATANTYQYLAVNLSSNSDAWTGIVDTPTSTGNNAQTGPGFEPEAVFMGFCMNATGVESETDDDAGGFGVGFFSANEEFCISTRDDDAATTTDCADVAESVAIRQNDINANTAMYRATFVSMDTNGWTLNYTVVDPTARRTAVLAIQTVAAGGLTGQTKQAGRAGGQAGMAGGQAA